jgi:putative ABC transport system permease protein
MAEVALGLLLTVGAGLLLQSFWRLRNVDAGFDPDGVLAASMFVPSSRYDSDEKVTAFYARLVERARSLPGVAAAAANSEVPLTTPSWSSDFAVDGRAPDTRPNEVVHREVTPGYLDVMRVPLIKGRDFTDEDRGDSPRVILINQALADRWFRGEDPLGKRLVFDHVPAPNPVWRTIVGVVGSERQRELRADARPEIFEPLTQHTRNRMTLMLRTAGDPATLAPSVRGLVAELDPELAITSIQTMAEVKSVSLARQRFLATLLLLFAVVGLALAVIGVYGVMAQVARQRLPEMAVRMALGADRATVQGLVVRRSLALVLPGVALGGAAAVATGGLLRAMLYEIAPADPVTLVAVAATLTFAAVVAAWWPAFRVSQADPAVTLRSE